MLTPSQISDLQSHVDRLLETNRELEIATQQQKLAKYNYDMFLLSIRELNKEKK